VKANDLGPQSHTRSRVTATSLERWIGQEVILDTEGPLTYLGTLRDVAHDGYWLENADIRDRREGHTTKEAYACEARTNGIRPNRRTIFVTAAVVVSASALRDVIAE
jgi:hypothetical protein